MKLSIVAITLITLLFLVGCSPVVCDEPYIRFGDSCCLDENSNSICDSDESNNNNEPIANIQKSPYNTQKKVNSPTALDTSYSLDDVKNNIEYVFRDRKSVV